MTKKIYLLIIAVLIQFFILTGIIVNYQWILNTGESFIVPTFSYDPSDLIRGEYLNLTYNISQYSGEYLSGLNNKDTIYVIPTFSGNEVLGIKDISKSKPVGVSFFKGKISYMTDESFLKLKVNYSGNDIISDYISYNGKFSIGDKVNVYYYDKILSGTINKNTPISNVINLSDRSTYIQDYYTDSQLVLSGEVIGLRKTETIRIDYGVDRFFISEGSWNNWNNKLLSGNTYGSWRVSKSGKIALEGLYISGVLVR